MRVGDTAVIDAEGLEALITTLAGLGYETKGPVVRDGAILPGPVHGVSDLPVGTHDVQAPGHYRLEQGEDETVFGWAVGPGSWKAEFFPPTQELWHSTVVDGTVQVTAPDPEVAPLAVIGARPCELVALGILDRVLLEGAYPDPRYAARRVGAFVVAAECGSPAATCFCTSMDSGPGAESGFDLALTELDDEDGHRFVVRVGTERGADILSRLPASEPTARDLAARDRVLSSAAATIDRRLETEGLADLLARNIEHPRWDEVAERCLACGNCTLVCPTCFCSDVSDTTDLTGDVRRQRTWASCFDLDHSYVHGGPVRSSTSARYRQWLTHKLSTWWDQFDTSGCVGCGRCIAWCPVGIDLTEEAAAIRASDGAVRSSGARPVPGP
ncbi:MAG: 4Fe-4S dicluster domain-containing protein [Acidimicrobiales bacterium]